MQAWPSRAQVRSVFRDGSSWTVSPQATESYRQLAVDLGYGADLWAMCLEREVLLHMIAQQHGLRYSPLIRALATGKKRSAADKRIELSEVSNLQKLLNAARKRNLD